MNHGFWATHALYSRISLTKRSYFDSHTVLVVNVDAAEPTATKPPVASTPFAPHTVPITATPHHVPVPVWNPNTPLAKMQNHSMIPLALIVGLIGGAFLIVVAAGIFTFFWHSKRTYYGSQREFAIAARMKHWMASGKTYNFSNPSFGVFRAIMALLNGPYPLSALMLTLHVHLVCILSLFLVAVTRLLHVLTSPLRHWFLTPMPSAVALSPIFSFSLTKAILNLLTLPQPSTTTPSHRPWSKTTEMKVMERTRHSWITESATHRCLLLKLRNEILKIVKSSSAFTFYYFSFQTRIVASTQLAWMRHPEESIGETLEDRTKDKEN